MSARRATGRRASEVGQAGLVPVRSGKRRRRAALRALELKTGDFLADVARETKG
jgi:hypothetical protein